MRAVDLGDSPARLIVVSDLHAFIQPLESLDALLSCADDGVRVVAAGDMLTGGPDPAAVLAWVRRRAGELAIVGNHDEGVLAGAGTGHSAVTEAGARERLDPGQLAYLADLPQGLDLAWRGHLVRIRHGHRTDTGETVSWWVPPSLQAEKFGSPAASLTVVGHTHSPYILEQDGARMANCGSTSMVLVGRRLAGGELVNASGESVPEPLPTVYSTFLSLRIRAGALVPELVRFDYDRRAALRSLPAMDDPDYERRRLWVTTGVLA